MKAGIRFETSKSRIVIAIDPDYFSWSPGEIETGKSSPAEYFNACSDRYWKCGETYLDIRNVDHLRDTIAKGKARKG